ncbi:hypothetical protein AUEXF2481DRAFT_8472 [Aureobasidium subglaciale EXF-2481]|uniref:Uncharacterized protein n=1 Tax=Aureobasidium subglaciale (strain EXF-2481) TaxID=1043005 RepID=A0A074Y1H5_AURSE|nr:uncharacterized protein AUEXF2481DRAFT_8472 [Aureobasidium subglaciale EXF-2481]KEQ91613.1 hypothetical protein AUEXF2481DRAFT_8472 [Aureobasidium subglaciale EXF-2481]
MSESESNSPTFVDPQAPLRQEIQRLKEKLEKTENNFEYYEESNHKFETEIEKQKIQIERKDAQITNLKEHIAANEKEHDETHKEYQAMRRRSSVLETTVKHAERELKTVADLELVIEDREEEARHATAELAKARTERDDKATEVKGLEGDIEALQEVLATQAVNIDALHVKLSIYERHLPVSSDLESDALDDVLYDFMTKYSVLTEHIPSSANKKNNRNSTGFNLADEFDALSSDGEFDSNDGYASDGRSARSDESDRAPQSIAQVLSHSAVQSIGTHPSIGQPVQTTSTATQTSPVNKPLPQPVSIATQTDPIRSPRKTSAPTNSNTETQTSPIAALIQKFTPKMNSSGVQTSPATSSPSKSVSEMVSNGVQMATNELSTKKTEPETVSAGVQTSPLVETSKKALQILNTRARMYSSVSTRGTTSKAAKGETTKSTATTSPAPKNAASGSGDGADTRLATSTKPAAFTTSALSPAESPPSDEMITNGELALEDFLRSQLDEPASQASDRNDKGKSPQEQDMDKPPTPPASAPPPAPSVATLPKTLFFPLHALSKEAQTHWELLALCTLTSFLAAFLGFSAANFATEHPWAQVNGYAPQTPQKFDNYYAGICALR